jgi:Flp pilus assembly protein protease CpaA
MVEIYAVAAVVLIGAGVVAGILTVVVLGIRREEKAYSLTIGSPGRLASGARVINGAHARTRRQQDLALAGSGRTPR